MCHRTDVLSCDGGCPTASIVAVGTSANNQVGRREGILPFHPHEEEELLLLTSEKKRPLALLLNEGDFALRLVRDFEGDYTSHLVRNWALPLFSVALSQQICAIFALENEEYPLVSFLYVL